MFPYLIDIQIYSFVEYLAQFLENLETHNSLGFQIQGQRIKEGAIIGAIVLPDAWLDRILAQIHLADEVKRVKEERAHVEQRLRRLAQVYLDGLKSEEEYRREKMLLEEKLGNLVVPGVDAAKEAGKLLEDLPRLWGEVNLGEQRRILLTMLDAVYVDTVEEKSIVAIRPKPAFRPLFEIAATREGSDVVLHHENEAPPHATAPEATSPCMWWRRGRVELPVQKTPREDMLQAYLVIISRSPGSLPAKDHGSQPMLSLTLPYRRPSGRTSTFWRPVPTFEER